MTKKFFVSFSGSGCHETWRNENKFSIFGLITIFSVLNLKVILSRISTCLKNSVKNYQFKKQHISRLTKKPIGTKNMRKGVTKKF